MKTLQSYLQEDEARFLSQIEHSASALQVCEVCEEQLQRILSRYNSQHISDARRQRAQYLMEVIRNCFPFTDSAAEIKLYKRSAYGEKDAGRAGARLCLAAAFACAAASFGAMAVSAGGLSGMRNLLAVLSLLALAMALFYVSGRLQAKKEADPELITEQKADAGKIFRSFSGVLHRCDGLLEDMEKQAVRQMKRPDERDAGPDADMLQYFADILECISGEEDEAAQEIGSRTEYFLHTRGIRVERNAAQHPEWFDMMPGKQAVLRPALMQGERVVCRGLAAGEKQ